MFIGYLLLSDYVYLSRNTDYAGIFRAGAMHNTPVYPETGDMYSLVWLRHCEALVSDDSSFIIELEIAKKFVLDYKAVGKVYDLVACIDVSICDSTEDNILPFEKEFLGYDVSDKHLHSIIFWYGYDRYDQTKSIISTNNLLRILSREYFGSKLNKYKLFSSYEDAKLLIEAESLIIKIHPHLNHLHITDVQDIKIYKLYKVLV